MSDQNSKTIAATISVITRESETFIGKLEKELATAQGQRLTEQKQQELVSKIEQARATYNAILADKRVQLEAAQTAEATALQKADKEIKANAASVKDAMKEQMLTAWITAGGDPDVFDQTFPQLYAAEMAKRALGAPTEAGGESRGANSQIVTGNF